MLLSEFEIQSDAVEQTDEHIISRYEYQTTEIVQDKSNKFIVRPKSVSYEFKTSKRVPKLG